MRIILKSTHRVPLAALLLGALAAIPGHAQSWQFTTIDPSAAFYTIIPGGINAAGTVSGLWSDPAHLQHGFIRTDSSFTSFDAPLADAGTVVALRGTAAGGINDAGTTVGAYTAGGVQHGFVRAASGAVTTLDIAGHLDTSLNDINNLNQTVGSYADTHGVYTGLAFLRSTSGALTPIAMPGSTFTEADGINDAGVIVGGYLDAANGQHGYQRAVNGVYTTIDVPGASATVLSGISNTGWVTGEYDDAGGTGHAFVRDPSGLITTLDVPGATFTSGGAINDSLMVVGQFCDAAGACHGFLASAVPEPTGAALMAGGLAAVLGSAGLRRRRVGLSPPLVPSDGFDATRRRRSARGA